MKRFLKIAAIVIAVLVVIAIALPFVIDANTFRPKLEAELTDALGRQVKVGNLSLSLLSGGVTADNISIADDPQFSKAPFVQAKSLKVGVEMIPLIFSRTLNVTELTLDQPQISLVKSENGEKWNFSSLGGKNPSAPTHTGGSAEKSAPKTSRMLRSHRRNRLRRAQRMKRARAGQSESVGSQAEREQREAYGCEG